LLGTTIMPRRGDRFLYVPKAFGTYKKTPPQRPPSGAEPVTLR
jgi:hypothetical protein